MGCISKLHTIAQDDSLLLKKANDIIRLSDKRHNSTFLGFLNEHESQILKDNFKDDAISFYGGYDGAVRLMMGVNANNNFPISVIKFMYRDEDKLSHKDFLGTLMGLGLERNVIGDILVRKGVTNVFVKSEIAQYIVSQVDKVKRTGVKVSVDTNPEITFNQNFDYLNLTLSSLRLDVFVSALCGLSREKANKLIRMELVTVNHYIVTNNSKTLSDGDIITIRKFGKFVFEESFGFSKKGKYKVLVKHYK